MSTRLRRVLPWVAAALVVVTLAVVLLVRCQPKPEPAASPPPPRPSASASPSPSPTPSPSPSPSPSLPPGVTEVANLPGDVPSYSGPGGQVNGTVAGSWWDYPSVLPVIDRRDGYLLVRLQQRPNESTAWIKQDGITVTETPYRIEIKLSARTVTLFKDNQVVFTAPAGVGADATPTPTGHFFVTMFAPGPKESYGPQVLALSAHSETINDWQGSGDAITAVTI